MRDLNGKRVLITGGAAGIGRAIAEAFADKGSEVVLVDLDEQALDEAATRLTNRGAIVHSYRLDVTDDDAVFALHDRLQRETGPIDILVNNAGLVFGGPFLDVPLEKHFRTYRVNILGLVAVTHAFLPDLIERPEGHLVNIASAAGYIGLPRGATYASTKWAVIGFSESMRLELGMLRHRNVHVTVVCPSYVGTGLFEGARPAKTTSLLTPEKVARLVIRAVERNRIVVRTPWLVKITPGLKGILPRPIWDLAARALGATSSMRQWQGHDVSAHASSQVIAGRR